MNQVASSAETVLDQDFSSMDLDDMLGLEETPRFCLEKSSSFTSPNPPRQSSFRSQRSLPTRNVSFGKCEIRVYERILSLNLPTQIGGPSLGLGWGYIEKKSVDLDKFETKRAFQWSTLRRTPKDIVMSPEKREKMARKLGYSSHEIEQNIKLIRKVQKQREKTAIDALTRLM
ncbi:expressed unknown protein [Seminavis robusta]|uniref:Uncharacterized protein n=1 Tax=Seminavis robusta TaxID=568900 RepID=A0A9N8HTA5_9STRA|nr:expressed unknown protein [Seminavis robusta]|eukprot:Sro1553_g281900.1 n/a (173) ;mRNA; f:1186-1704